LVSIGTGVPSLKPFTGDLMGVGQSPLAIAKETVTTAERFYRDKSGLDDNSRKRIDQVDRSPKMDELSLKGGVSAVGT
jgi:hypothetical protein